MSFMNFRGMGCAGGVGVEEGRLEIMEIQYSCMKFSKIIKNKETVGIKLG